MSISEEGKQGKHKLTPAEIVIIAAILEGRLEVASFLVDRDNLIQIILEGTIGKKSKKDELLDQLQEMDMDDIVAALLGRFG